MRTGKLWTVAKCNCSCRLLSHSLKSTGVIFTFEFQLFEEMGLQGSTSYASKFLFDFLKFLSPEQDHSRRDGYYCKHCRAYHAYSGSDAEDDGEYDMARDFGSIHHNAERKARREQARLHKEQKKRERKAMQKKAELERVGQCRHSPRL